jgi:hypothetical protein
MIQSKESTPRLSLRACPRLISGTRSLLPRLLPRAFPRIVSTSLIHEIATRAGSRNRVASRNCWRGMAS